MITNDIFINAFHLVVVPEPTFRRAVFDLKKKNRGLNK